MIGTKTIKIFSQRGKRYCKNGNFGDNLTNFFSKIKTYVIIM